MNNGWINNQKYKNLTIYYIYTHNTHTFISDYIKIKILFNNSKKSTYKDDQSTQYWNLKTASIVYYYYIYYAHNTYYIIIKYEYEYELIVSWIVRN